MANGAMLLCLIFAAQASAALPPQAVGAPGAGERATEFPDPAAIRPAVARALPVLQRSGEEWYESRACSSCHHAALNLLAAGAVRERGWPVDEELAGTLLERYRRSSPDVDAEIVQGDAGINAQIGQSYRLLALAAAEEPRNATTDAVVHFLAGRQQPDGRWASESHRPPLEDSEVTATALAARALQLYAPPGRTAEIGRRVGRARAWLEQLAPRDTEDRVMQLFGLAWTGAAPERMEAAAAALLSEQRADGGWAQIPTRESDAYATGAALVALRHVGGLAPGDARFRRGIAFLLRTQLPDGTWLVETRRRGEGLKHFETGFPHGIHQFISFAATCWAVSALCSAVDPAPSPLWTGTAGPARASDDAASGGAPHADDGLPPLLHAALYEDVAAMQALLDAGADANVRGPRGLTSLIAAAGDAAKVRLLLDHGADAAARSELGLTPLLAAAAYDGGLDALELLLARAGESVSEADLGEALRRAALGGDIRKVDVLLEAGAELDARADSGETALALAGYQGDAAMIRQLVARGAEPDVDLEGVTPLTIAVIDGQRDAVLALLEAGADVNARDGGADGPTPLMWAAIVDRGDTAVLAALIAAGADVHARASRRTTVDDTTGIPVATPADAPTTADAPATTALQLAEARGNAHAAALLRAAGARE